MYMVYNVNGVKCLCCTMYCIWCTMYSCTQFTNKQCKCTKYCTV